MITAWRRARSRIRSGQGAVRRLASSRRAIGRLRQLATELEIAQFDPTSLLGQEPINLDLIISPRRLSILGTGVVINHDSLSIAKAVEIVSSFAKMNTGDEQIDVPEMRREATGEMQASLTIRVNGANASIVPHSGYVATLAEYGVTMQFELPINFKNTTTIRSISDRMASLELSVDYLPTWVESIEVISDEVAYTRVGERRGGSLVPSRKLGIIAEGGGQREAVVLLT
jgi:hypothetical protein